MGARIGGASWFDWGAIEKAGGRPQPELYLPGSPFVTMGDKKKKVVLHKPGGGDKKIETHKLDFKAKAQSKIGSKDNVDHKAGGGTSKVFTEKLEFDKKAESKIGSTDNIDHEAGGGQNKVFTEKLEFEENAEAKTDSGLG
ncbi:hypothetical protein LSAT2_007684 [Lamellibrachia satsuma]|nr:hypothetical protein LSAT2_007684 [Lamellibrachia satsuma]